MTTKEMKELLATKLHEEGTYFTKSDISIKKIKDGYRIVIKDYEHIPFELKMEQDDFFGYMTMITANGREVYFSDSKRAYDPFNAILHLGYYIGSRF